jgi:pyruvate formate lyase activating enzyme
MGYGVLSSVHVDPIEKKPLYHFHPGSSILSWGGWGCNFGCTFCQNWTISQDFRKSETIHTSGQMVQAMHAEGCSLMAYTYNEPLVGFEFVRDCSRLVRQEGGKNVLVTNGFIEETPAAELLPLVDALNVDIKSMEEGFYKKYCKGALAPVLRFCRQAVKAGCHLEVTNLIIPGLNDTDKGLEQLAAWIHDELGPLTPLHLSAYHPDFCLEVPPTSGETLHRAWDISRKTLAYVYMGNLLTKAGQDTLCPGCGSLLIGRRGYQVSVIGLRTGACARCGRKADVIT